MDPIVENQDERDQAKIQDIKQHRRLISGDVKRDVKGPERKDRSRSKSKDRELEQPVSFEYRYTNKFTGAEQYEAYKK